MNVRKSILAAAAALLIVVGGAGNNVSAAPSDQGDATVSITSTGVLSVTVTDANFGTHLYNYLDQDVTGSLTVNATDARGSGAGWSVHLTATDFIRDNTDLAGAEKIAIGNLDLMAGAVTATTPGADTSSITTGSATPVLASGGTQIMYAAPRSATYPRSGMGGFALAMDGTLTIPGGTVVGNYLSYVTVTINGLAP